MASWYRILIHHDYARQGCQEARMMLLVTLSTSALEAGRKLCIA